MSYLKATDPGALDGLTKIEPRKWMVGYKECPICIGHGGWHLRVDAYGPGRHFDCMCSHCNGSGHVPATEACAPHDWGDSVSLGRCWTRYTCRLCGKNKDIDSSD